MNRPKWFAATAIMFAVLTFAAGLIGCEEGDWACSACGLQKRMKMVVFFVTEEGPGRSNRYHRFFREKLNTAHEHDWIRVGCHGIQGVMGDMIACSPDFDRRAIIQLILENPNEPARVKAGQKLLALSPADRKKEFEEASFFDGIHIIRLWLPFARRNSDHDELAAEYSKWRDSHPYWHDVFPPVGTTRD